MNARKLATIAIAAALLAAALPAAAASRLEREYALADGGVFVLDTDVGSVEVRGTSASGVRVVISSRSEDLLDQFDLQVAEGGDRLELSFEKKGSRLGSWMSWGRSGNVKFEIEVPARTKVEIDTAGGSITAESIDAEVSLDTSGGSIAARSIGGKLSADTSGGSISVEDVDGDVDADTSGGSITVRGVRGNLLADTSGGSIVVADVSGDISADTSGGSIEIEGAGGQVEADTSGGSITVVFLPGNSRGGTLSTSGGGIQVGIDKSVGLDLDAVASGGSVVVNVDVAVRGKVEKSTVQGKIGGGGNLLKLRASGGKIRVDPL